MNCNLKLIKVQALAMTHEWPSIYIYHFCNFIVSKAHLASFKYGINDISKEREFSPLSESHKKVLSINFHAYLYVKIMFQ